MTTRINLLSGPRNISTALMYSFAQRTDIKVFDEPLYAHYLSKTNAKDYHPGAHEILKSQNNDGSEVVKMMLSNNQSEVLFFKNMAHHIIEIDYSFLLQMTNVFLTRHPKEMLASFSKVISNPTIDEVGYKKHLELLEFLEAKTQKPIVLDSRVILNNPERTLKSLCSAIGIPFEENMLKWPSKPIKEDGVWAKYWYKSVHQSTHFMKNKTNTNPFPKHLNQLLEECMHYYNRLLEYSIG